jgi:hypothetical protein
MRPSKSPRKFEFTTKEIENALRAIFFIVKMLYQFFSILLNILNIFFKIFEKC